MSIWKIVKNGVTNENPTFRLVLGMCPTLAVTTSLINGLGMGLATTLVLAGSNLLISLLRNVIPDKIRIPCFVVVIATLVTIIDSLMQAYLPSLAEVLGIYIPLIVVNCIILARAETFASKNRLLPSLLDGVGMGLGFTVSLSVLGMVRELLGTGKFAKAADFGFAGITLLPRQTAGLIMILPPGAFITLGLLMGFLNQHLARKGGNKDEL